MVVVKQIAYQSAEYQLACQLRDVVLRRPLGLVLSPQDTHGEASQIHFVAMDNASVCGTCILKPLADRRYELRQFAVDGAYQSCGVGSSLVRGFEQYIAEQGGLSVEMSARCSAQPFYERFGYVASGALYEKVGIPHTHMEKQFL